MKWRKASAVDILSFVLIFTMFSAFIAGYVYNNAAQESRSFIIDYLNDETATLQKQLKGYSKTSKYCYMMKNGRVLSYSSAQSEANNLVKETKSRIVNTFKTLDSSSNKTGKKITRMATLVGEPVITINDSSSIKGSATVTITIQYVMSYRSPYIDDTNDLATDSTKDMIITETATRTIENPFRVKNL